MGSEMCIRDRAAGADAVDVRALAGLAIEHGGRGVAANGAREFDADAVVAALASRLKAEQQARLQTEEQAATMLAHEEASITILEARVRDLQAKLAAVRDGRPHHLAAGTPHAVSRTPSPSAALATLERRHDLSMRAMSALSSSPLAGPHAPASTVGASAASPIAAAPASCSE